MSELSFPVRSASVPAQGALRPSSQDVVFTFRSFRLAPGARSIHRDGVPVELGSRAFDLLVVLLRARGTVVSKRQIMQDVWPSTLVDESNLRFQMACLRRELGAHRDLIKTVQGRGYLFIAEEVTVLGETPPTPAPRSDRIGPPVVAVVDDDDNTREALDSLLRSWGYQVETYAASQALAASGRASAVECLVLDVWLPGRSGLDYQADLKSEGIDVPIVFISGHADIHMSVRAMKAGAVEFLTKPVRHEDLHAAIESAVLAGRA